MSQSGLSLSMWLIAISITFFINLRPCLGFEGWIDPDTHHSKHKIHGFTNPSIEYDLVMSDEFNVPKRSFANGHDPMWTAIDKSDDDQTSSGKMSLEFYNSSMISTSNGKLVITTNTEDTKWRGWDPYAKKYVTMKRHFKSGMLQSWNKFCFTGGILEVDVQFPGRSDVGGLWPAVWLLGNLGRATYEASTNLLWPWSYPQCDKSLQAAQEISGCDVTSHYSMHSGQGRGATEIDIVEIMPGPSTPLPFVRNHVRRPYNSMTLQVSPGIPSSKRRPLSGTLPEWGFHWYSNLTMGKNTSINPFFYGTYLGATKSQEPVRRSREESYQCDAISSIASLEDSFFNSLHTFRLEWQPGKDDGYIHWYIDGEFKFGIEAASLKEQGSMIPNEPSSIILNTAISTSWGFPNPPWGCTLYDCKDPEGQCGFNPGFCKSLPASFLVDYIRIYQNKNDSRQTIGCNPRDYPTKKFIEGHAYRYRNDEFDGEGRPLKAIQHGQGRCHRDEDCGGSSRGLCRRQKCFCDGSWTGPHCLVPDYKNPFPDWENEYEVPIFRPQLPRFLLGAACLLVIILSLLALRDKLFPFFRRMN